ncbi:hypothetical protein ACFE04_003527 [Oxalis oulophora]
MLQFLLFFEAVKVRPRYPLVFLAVSFPATIGFTNNRGARNSYILDSFHGVDSPLLSQIVHRCATALISGSASSDQPSASSSSASLIPRLISFVSAAGRVPAIKQFDILVASGQLFDLLSWVAVVAWRLTRQYCNQRGAAWTRSKRGSVWSLKKVVSWAQPWPNQYSQSLGALADSTYRVRFGIALIPTCPDLDLKPVRPRPDSALSRHPSRTASVSTSPRDSHDFSVSTLAPPNDPNIYLEITAAQYCPKSRTIWGGICGLLCKCLSKRKETN